MSSSFVLPGTGPFPVVPASAASKEVKQQYFRDGLAWILGSQMHRHDPITADLIKSAQIMFHLYEELSWAAIVEDLKRDAKFQIDLVCS